MDPLTIPVNPIPDQDLDAFVNKVHSSISRISGNVIQGKGLRTTSKLKKGTILFVRGENDYQIHNMEEITQTEMRSRYFENYGFQIDENLYTIPIHEEEVEHDYSNFWNHSCEPTTWILNDYMWCAARDIEEGEELTLDYSTFDTTFDLGECFCKSPNCRGRITRNDYQLLEVRNKYWGHFQGYIARRIIKEFPNWRPE